MRLVTRVASAVLLGIPGLSVCAYAAIELLTARGPLLTSAIALLTFLGGAGIALIGFGKVRQPLYAACFLPLPFFFMWTIELKALPGSAWVQIQSSTVKVNGCFEVLHVPEAARHALDLLNLTVEALAHCVGHRMLVVGQDIVNVSADRLGRLTHRLQSAVRGPEIPLFPELPA